MSANAKSIRKVLDYDPSTGVFHWRIRPTMKKRAGDVAGDVTTAGRWRIKYAGRSYQAHRLAWLYVHGEWPTNQIDHIDGDPLNNRINNLRDVTAAVNQHNRKRASRGNLTGLIGAAKSYGGKFRAQIHISGKTIGLGTFVTALEAHEAYLKAKRELHPDGYV